MNRQRGDLSGDSAAATTGWLLWSELLERCLEVIKGHSNFLTKSCFLFDCGSLGRQFSKQAQKNNNTEDLPTACWNETLRVEPVSKREAQCLLRWSLVHKKALLWACAEQNKSYSGHQWRDSNIPQGLIKIKWAPLCFQASQPPIFTIMGFFCRCLERVGGSTQKSASAAPVTWNCWLDKIF